MDQLAFFSRLNIQMGFLGFYGIGSFSPDRVHRTIPVSMREKRHLTFAYVGSDETRVFRYQLLKSETENENETNNC